MPESISKNAYYYTPGQVADMLSMDLFEVNKLVNRGELPAVSIDKHRWLPAKAVEDLVREKYGPGNLTHAPQPHILDKSENYYTVDEVAQRLGRGHHEIWRMAYMGKLRVDAVGDQRLFLKQSVDGFLRNAELSADNGNEALDAPTSDKSTLTSLADRHGHYTVREAAEKLGKSPDEVWEMVYRGELSVSTVNGERVFPKRDVDDLASKDHPEPVQSKTSHLSEGKGSEMQTSQGSEAAMSEDRYYTPGQAARLLDKDPYKINRMIYRKELPIVRVDDVRWIPEQSVENLMPKSAQRRWERHEDRPKAIRESEIQKSDLPNRNEQEVDKKADKLEDSSNSVKPEAHVHLSTPEDASEVTSAPSQSQSEAGLKEEVEMLRDELRAEKERNQRLTQELDQERADRAQEIQNARYEIDRSSAQTENLRRDYAMQSETLQEDLEEERRRRIERELRVEELQDQLEEEKRSRGVVKGVVGSLRGLISHENDGEDVERQDLELALDEAKRRLEEEKNRQRKNEEWLGDLRSKLEQNEARKKELEEALSSEKGKMLRLEEEKHMLDEIRRVLGTDTSQPSERAETATPVDARKEESDKSNSELLINTRHGQWNFRPPFDLEGDEIELLRLVAGEDEITAEQIKTKSGRRRAADDLDELLDRLHAAGVEPIKEINDRYSFDPNFLQD